MKPRKRFWPLKIPISHWQLRHFISHSEPDHIYYASKSEVYRLNTITKKAKLIAILPFDARCTASGYGWVCVGGGEGDGHFAAIKLDGSGDVDAALPINAWRSERRPPNVKIESLGEEIVNSISIHRIQDEEAHLDDIVAVVTNNDKTVRIYSLPQGAETKVLQLPDPMNHATLSPDGKMLAAVGDCNEAFFFERVLKEKPPLIPKPHNRLTSANLEWRLVEVCELYVHNSDSPRGYFTTAWSPDGRHVAVGSEGCYITLFDVESLRCPESGVDPVIAVIPSSRADCQMSYVGSVRSMMFSPAPWDLLIWAEDQGRVCIGDLRSGLQRKQVLDLNLNEEGLEKVVVEDTTAESATQDEIEQQLQRNFADLEAEFQRRIRYPQSSGTYSMEYLRARNRQQSQRHDSTQQNEQLVDDPRGLSADEQQILQTLRTTRQREEARAGGRAPGTIYATIEALINRSSAASTPSTVDSSTRPISDILTSVQDSLPELSRTNARSSRPSSTNGQSATIPTSTSDVQGAMVPTSTTSLTGIDLQEARDRYNARSFSPIPGNQTPETGSQSRATHLGHPRESSPMSLLYTQIDMLQQVSRQRQLLTAASAADVEDDNPWRTIQDAMATARGPLFENAARAPAIPSPESNPQLTAESTELAEIQALARRRNRLRAARMSLSNARNGGTATSTTAVPDAYDLFRRRMTGRDMGVRTAGLAMSRDGSTLWAACEEGIFEFQMNNKGRMFWPAIAPR